MMLFSSLSIVIVIVPEDYYDDLAAWKFILFSFSLLYNELSLTMDAPHMGCQRGTHRCGAAAPVRRGEQRGDRCGNIDD